jgi:hypothetical protein
MALSHPHSYNQYRGNRLVTGPALEPVGITTVKNQLRIQTTNDEDDLLELYIQSARELIEEHTGLALITQTWKLTLDDWPNSGERWWDGVRDMPISELRSTSRASDVLLPRYPLQSVDTITADGTAITIADTFITDTAQIPGRLVVKRGATWPVVLDQAAGIEITYSAGFGDAASDVPAAIRLAIVQMVATMYEHRGDGCTAAMAYAQSGAKNIVETYRAAKL